ncbi:MAG TPA: hypothetical protein VI818_05810 [Candidatus Thermoplasmatota archaeon]|nr:hypothetical protein [Candidatus Thermoplasmatota archaeon]
MRSVAVLLVLAFATAGCFGGAGGADTTASPSPTPPPPPQVVYGPKQPNACQSPAAPEKTEAPGDFVVAAPYDEILVNYHTSGVGKGRFTVKNKDTGAVVYQNPTEDIRSVPPETCGGHAHSGGAVTKSVAPGNYTVTLWYQGAVAIHADVTLKASKVAANTTHAH